MSANRKLQTEVVQVLKKVEEGIVIFDEIWEKVYAAEQQSLKEKYESDLKKEIKKLQRLRDQIKSWLSNNEVKDKAPLLEARKVIEGKMESFKICEKETKTKAYSKEGLARGSADDPKEVDREEKRNWINDCLQRLGDIIDGVEVELDKVSGGRGKTKNKDAIEKLENRLKKNRWHVAKLEEILRLLDSGDLDPAKLEGGVKDDVEYYIESATDDDGALAVDDEFNVYEDLQLEQLAEAAMSMGLHHPTVSNAAASATAAATDADSDDAGPTASTAAESKPAAVSGKKGGPGVVTVAGITTTIPAAAAAGAKATPATAHGKTPAATAAAPQAKAGAKPTATAAPVAAAKTPAASAVAGAKPTAAAAVAGSAAVANGAKKDSKQAKGEEKKTDKSEDGPAPVVPATSSWSSPLTAAVKNDPSKAHTPTAQHPTPAAAAQPSQPVAASPLLSSSTVPASTAPPPTPTSSLPASAPSNLGTTTATAPIDQPAPASTPAATVGGAAPTQAAVASKPQVIASPVVQSQPGPAPASQPSLQTLPPVIANANTAAASASTQVATSAPAAPMPKPTPLSADALMAITMLKHSMIHTPENLDNDKHSNYAPRNPYPSAPASFPTVPPPQLESAALFERLPADALFFAFYNQPGSYQQYLAARQLKKLSWRFHKKYMTWFQRHEEPKVTTEDYEEGTYVYFDYESGWCQRIKSEFKFEYAYLEDEVQSTS